MVVREQVGVAVWLGDDVTVGVPEMHGSQERHSDHIIGARGGQISLMNSGAVHHCYGACFAGQWVHPFSPRRSIGCMLPTGPSRLACDPQSLNHVPDEASCFVFRHPVPYQQVP